MIQQSRLASLEIITFSERMNFRFNVAPRKQEAHIFRIAITTFSFNSLMYVIYDSISM